LISFTDAFAAASGEGCWVTAPLSGRTVDTVTGERAPVSPDFFEASFAPPQPALAAATTTATAVMRSGRRHRGMAE
jgi:hypothetical protein